MIPFQGLVSCTEDPAFPEYVGLGMAAANTKIEAVIYTDIDINVCIPFSAWTEPSV